MLIGFCDNNIDFTKPVSFPDISQHEYAGDSYNCGVISGETELGRRIGIRFISAEPNHLIIGFKSSRRQSVFIVKTRLRLQNTVGRLIPLINLIAIFAFRLAGISAR